METPHRHEAQHLSHADLKSPDRTMFADPTRIVFIIAPKALLAVERWYDFAEFGGYLGNVGD